MLMYAVHAKCVIIALRDLELVDSMRVINGGKSYNKKVYNAYTAKTSNSIDPVLVNK